MPNPSPDTARLDRRAGALLPPRRRGDRPARPVTTAFRSGGRLVAVPAVERVRMTLPSEQR